IFAIISGLLSLSARQHPEAKTFADEFSDRLAALSKAHDYARPHGTASQQGTVLGDVRRLLSPYALDGRELIVVEGDDTTRDGQYRLCWKEQGGPPVHEPERFGFGSRLVDMTLCGQLGGELNRDWQRDGLEVCLSAPVDRLSGEARS